MGDKDQQIGFRVSAALKMELQEVAHREARTLSQICEFFVRRGLNAYKKEGPRYLDRFLSRHKKERKNQE